MKPAALFILFVLIAVSNCGCGQSNEKSITAANFSKLNNDSIILIDIRTPEEFQSGNIIGSKNIDWYNDSFMNEMNHFDKADVIYIYCRSGSRSSSASQKLTTAGFQNIITIKGGYQEYSKSVKP